MNRSLVEQERWCEARQHAWKLKESGWCQLEIAQALAVNPTTVGRWFKKAREKGVEALYEWEYRGRRPYLTAEQQQQLLQLLAGDTAQYGFWGNFWTYERISRVIQSEFGVTYTERYLSQLLTKLGWRPPKLEPCVRRRVRLMEQWRAELNAVMGIVHEELGR